MMRLTNLEKMIIKEIEYSVQNNCSNKKTAQYFGLTCEEIDSHFNKDLKIILEKYPEHQYYQELYNLYCEQLNKRKSTSNSKITIPDSDIRTALANIKEGSNYKIEASKINVATDTLRKYAHELGDKDLEIAKLLKQIDELGKQRKSRKNPIPDEDLYQVINNILAGSTMEKEAVKLGKIARTIRLYMRELADKDKTFKILYERWKNPKDNRATVIKNINKKEVKQNSKKLESSKEKINTLSSENRSILNKEPMIDDKIIPIEDIYKIGNLLLNKEISFSEAMRQVPYSYIEVCYIFYELLPIYDINMFRQIIINHNWNDDHIEAVRELLNSDNDSKRSK